MPAFVDGIFDSDPLLKKAKEDGWYESWNGGSEFELPINYAQATAVGSYSGAETLNITDNDILTVSTVAWKQYYASVIISGRDEMVNKGTEQVLDFVKTKMKIAQMSLKDTMSTDAYSGSSSTALVGLDTAIGTSNTYNGISQTTNTWWAGNVNSTTTTLSIGAMRTLYTTCTINGEKPNLGLATRTVFNSYHGLLQPQERFSSTKEADGGIQNLLFAGCPIAVSTKATTGDLYFLNTKFLHLFYHPDRDFIFTGFDKPVNQDVKVGQVLWMGALASDNNRMHGRFTALTAQERGHNND
jgi:hypothetical protein